LKTGAYRAFELSLSHEIESKDNFSEILNNYNRKTGAREKYSALKTEMCEGKKRRMIEEECDDKALIEEKFSVCVYLTR